MNKPVKKVVIVGGGTAGWLTAGILAAEHNGAEKAGLDITLIESKNIKPIGVGEGTWPTMRDTLTTIGISEFQFIQCCDASFKQGSQFIDWVNGSENDNFYHPFIAPHGFGQSNMVRYWQNNHTNLPFAHAVSNQPHLCEKGLAPKQIQTPEFAAVANYGYHLNAGKFATLLQQHCVQYLGVNHVIEDVNHIIEDKHGSIDHITTQAGTVLSADLFIDCSGIAAILLGQHYKIPLKNQKHILFNDSALAVQVPYQKNDSAIASHTKSTAHDAGWLWDIGLPNRRGVGCVYASDYMSDDEAYIELKAYIGKSHTPEQVDKLDIRKLSFTPGYREKFWHKNCVAIGMSSGFIEPLEASALALVELSAKMIAKELPANTAIMPITAERFNQRFQYRWERIIEFLKLHYLLSKRTSPYWQANREQSSIPERLSNLLTLWQYQEPSYNDFTEIEEIFPAASYQYILYGMGFKTENRQIQRRFDNDTLSEKFFNENQQLITQYLAGLPTNRALIDSIIQRRLNNKVS